MNSNSLSGPTLSFTGPFKILTIYIKFNDDSEVGDARAGWAQWPHDEPFPLLESYAVAETSSNIPSNSLTRNLLKQSRGNFIATGSSFSYTTSNDESYYISNGYLDETTLANEALSNLDAVIDYNDYDANGDGYVDHVQFIIRNTNTSNGIWGGAQAFAYNLNYASQADYVNVNWSAFNLYQKTSPPMQNVRHMLHELGHHLFNIGASHIDPIPGNKVPYIDPNTGSYSVSADTRNGFHIMSGAGTGHNVLQTAIMSAFERHRLSTMIGSSNDKWIECPRLTSDTHVELGALNETGDCIRFGGSSGDYERFISNLQHTDIWTETTTAITSIGSACQGYHEIEVSALPVTGLLVEHVDLSRSSYSHTNPRKDIVPADNELRGWMDGCAEFPANSPPSAEDVFSGDLFKPQSNGSEPLNQLTPWTRPNSWGRTFVSDVPAGERANNWSAIDDIKSASGNKIAFEYIQDFRLQPIIRSDSWIGTEVASYTFQNDIVVESGATLTITMGATINLASGVDISVESGGQLVVEEGVTFNMGASSELNVRGHLAINGGSGNEVAFQRGGTSAWEKIYLYGSGADDSSIRHVTIDGARYGIYASSVDNIDIWYTIVTGSTYYGLYAYSSSIDEIYQSTFQQSVNHDGIYFRSSSGRVSLTSLTDNGRHGMRLYKSDAVYFGGGEDAAYNVLTDNDNDGLYAYGGSSATLGDYMFVGPPLIYGGYNIIDDNGGYDISVLDSSDILAEWNWWGEDPPSTGDFNIASTANFDYDPWLDSAPSGASSVQATVASSSGLSPQVQGRATSDSSRVDSEPDLMRVASASTGAFVRQVHRVRVEKGRTASAQALSVVAATSGHRHHRLAQIFRLGDLLHLGRADEVIPAAEALFRNPRLGNDARRMVAELLFVTYVEERNDQSRAQEMLRALAELGAGEDDLAPLATLLEEKQRPQAKSQQQTEVLADASPKELAVANYPNPFNPSTVIRYTLPEAGPVTLTVYDVLGRVVDVLVDGVQEAGAHQATFEAPQQATGVYLYRLEAQHHVQTGRMLLVK